MRGVQLEAGFQRDKGERKMSKIDIIRAWKDESYRLSLSEAERAPSAGEPGGSGGAQRCRPDGRRR